MDGCNRMRLAVALGSAFVMKKLIARRSISLLTLATCHSVLSMIAFRFLDASAIISISITKERVNSN